MKWKCWNCGATEGIIMHDDACEDCLEEEE